MPPRCRSSSDFFASRKECHQNQERPQRQPPPTPQREHHVANARRSPVHGALHRCSLTAVLAALVALLSACGRSPAEPPPVVASGAVAVTLGSWFHDFIRAHPRPPGRYLLQDDNRHVVETAPGESLLVVRARGGRVGLVSMQRTTPHSTFEAELATLRARWGEPAFVLDDAGGSPRRQALWDRAAHRMYIVEFEHDGRFFVKVVAVDKRTEQADRAPEYLGL
jgi:hypothetical protein